MGMRQNPSGGKGTAKRIWHLGGATGLLKGESASEMDAIPVRTGICPADEDVGMSRFAETRLLGPNGNDPAIRYDLVDEDLVAGGIIFRETNFYCDGDGGGLFAGAQALIEERVTLRVAVECMLAIRGCQSVAAPLRFVGEIEIVIIDPFKHRADEDGACWAGFAECFPWHFRPAYPAFPVDFQSI